MMRRGWPSEKAEAGKIPGDGTRRLYSSGLIARTPSALNKDVGMTG